MSQITCNGSGPASSLTASAVPSGCVGDHVGDQPAGSIADRSLDARHHFWGERSADDGSQTLVPRVVEHDHRAEVFGDLRCLVVDGDVGAGAEDLRMTAGVEHVVESGECPMPVAFGEALLNRLAPERDRRLAPKCGERPVALIVVERPEVPCAEIDVCERNVRRRCAIHPGRNAHVVRPRRRAGCRREPKPVAADRDTTLGVVRHTYYAPRYGTRFPPGPEAGQTK